MIMGNEIKIKLSDGRELVAKINNYDGENIELCVYTTDDTDKQNIIYQNICLIREGVKNDVECLVWGTADDEDYTEIFSIEKHEGE